MPVKEMSKKYITDDITKIVRSLVTYAYDSDLFQTWRNHDINTSDFKIVYIADNASDSLLVTTDDMVESQLCSAIESRLFDVEDVQTVNGNVEIGCFLTPIFTSEENLCSDRGVHFRRCNFHFYAHYMNDCRVKV